MMRCITAEGLGWALIVTAFVGLVLAPAMVDLTKPEPPTVQQCEVVYADSYDIRAAVLADELDVFDALQLGPDSYHRMVFEAYETTLPAKTFSARWLGMCLAGRITPREVD